MSAPVLQPLQKVGVSAHLVAPVLKRAPSGALQRCGGSPCSSCEEDNHLLQRRAFGSAPPTIAPIVREVLGSGGQPLDRNTRAFFEERFGHDFGRVRVHTDARAADSARAVNAYAYTVGQDVVFGAGRYEPATSAGKRLLAHELTHVVQQGNKAPGAALPSSISPLADRAEDEAEKTAEQVVAGHNVAVDEDEAAGKTMHRFPILPPLVDIKVPMQAVSQISKALDASCDHKAALTWADFTGTVPAKNRFSAETRFHFDQAAVGTDQIIKAIFDGGSSWVRAQFADPTNRAVNGANPQIAACERFFDAEAKAGRTGATYHLSPGAGCAASVGPDPSVLANSRTECTDVLGPKWDRAASLESQRLLKHEQNHYSLACALGRKGTQAVLSGSKPADILRAVVAASTTQTTKYDTETAHGCNATPQANWDQAIADGLPAVTIP